jgi:hypothetical protein
LPPGNLFEGETHFKFGASPAPARLLSFSRFCRRPPS